MTGTLTLIENNRVIEADCRIDKDASKEMILFFASIKVIMESKQGFDALVRLSINLKDMEGGPCITH